ncbi:MAG: sugar transferase [Elusimicrobia bacterium]|nr:sugar transferase [Elusimicrobiota bacterium]
MPTSASRVSEKRLDPSAVPSAPSALVPRWFRHLLRGVLQVAADAGAVALSYRMAYEIRFHWDFWTVRFPFAGHDPGWDTYSRLLLALIPLWIGVFWYSSQLYTKPWRAAEDRFLFIVKGAILGSFAILSGTFIYGRMEYSRHLLILAIPLVAASVAISETLVLWLDRWVARFESTSPIFLIGSGRVSEVIRESLSERHPGIRIHERAQIGDVSALITEAKTKGISEMLLAQSNAGEHEKILALAEACESADIQFKMIPDLLELRLGEIQMDDTLGLPAYRIQHTSLSRSHYIVKRVFDLAVSLAVLAVAGVPCAVIALLIKLDSKGPILYRQKRLGLRGRVFEAFKFRTMIVDAEKRLEKVKATANDQKGGFFKAKEDPRITAVGRRLRRYSLDEFPQFINVFLGEMSVVGPRPLAVSTGEMEELVREFGPTAKKRLNILPGITGLWQVSGRSDVSAAQRFSLDLFYIEHWSLGLDFQIILKTVPAMLSGKGAY